MSPSLRCCSRKQPARKENKRKAKKKKEKYCSRGKKRGEYPKKQNDFPSINYKNK